MTITLNGEKYELSKKITVWQLLEQEEVKMPEYITVQLNEEILEKEDFESTDLKEGDTIDFLYFMGGGSK